MEPTNTTQTNSLNQDIAATAIDIGAIDTQNTAIFREKQRLEQRKSRKRILLMSGIPLLITILLLSVLGGWQSRRSNKQAEPAQNKIISGIKLNALKLDEALYDSLNSADKLVVNGNLVANSGMVLDGELVFNGESYTDLTGSGLTVIDGELQTTLGASVDLGSEVSGVTQIINGGTGATTAQAAINALAGLTGTGDLLYFDGDNTTRLARGANGECLQSTGSTVIWVSCIGAGAGLFDIVGSSGAPQTINDGDTITIAAGTNTTSVSGVTDTVTLSVVDNPTFSGLVTLNGGLTIETGDTLIFNGESFNDLTGTGLSESGGVLQATLGTDISGIEIVDGTIEEVDLESTNAPTDSYVLTFDIASGGFTWVDPTTVGIAYSFDVTDGITPQTINNGNVLNLIDGTNIDVVTGAPDNLTVSLINNPTLSGLLTLNGGLTVEAGDTLTFNGNAFTDLTGTGLQLISGNLETTLGTSIQNAEVDDDLTISAGGTVADGALSANVSLLGSTIDLSSEITGTLPVLNGGTGSTTPLGARGNLGAAASGANADITSLSALTAITPAAALTIGATGQSLTLQGSAASTFTATDSGFTTTVGFVTPTANATINFPTLAAGTYSVCTTSGNCLGGGGGGANTALSNLSGVAINTSLLTGAATIDLGSDANSFRDLYLSGTVILEGSSADGNEITLSVADPTADITYNFADVAAGTYDICTSTGNCVGGGGSAPSGADYLTLSLNGSLSSERVLTAGTNISVADGGANSTLTLSLINNPTLSGLLTLNGGLTVEAGDTFTFNGDAFTDLTGTGLQLSSGNLQTTLGVSVDVTSEITGTLPVLNGGTGATSTQGAINALSQLTTNGDLLYFDGANSTRFARGANGECLTSNATTLLWGTCASGGTTYFTLAGTSGSAQSINGGDTVTVAAGTNITTTAGVTDTVTVATVDNPVFGTSVTSPIFTSTAALAVTGGTTVTIASTGAGNDVIINGADILDVQDNATFAGTLTVTSTATFNGNTAIGDAVTDNLTITSAIQGANALIFDGATDDTNEITLTVADPGADFTITLPAETGTVCLTSGNCAGVGGTGDILNNGQNGQVRIGSNDANSLIFESNGTDRITIDNLGLTTFTSGLTGITTIATSSTINSQTISSSANFTGTLAVQGASVTVGTSSTTNGTLRLLNSTNAFGITVSAANQTVGNATVTFPNTAGVADTFCLLTLANCSGSGGANTALSNLASVAINVSLLPASDDAIDLGDNTHRFRDLYLGGETLHIGTATGDEGALTYTTSTNALNLSSTGVISLQGAGGTVQIGSSTTGLSVTSAGAISDINGNVAVADTVDITGSLTVSADTTNAGYISITGAQNASGNLRFSAANPYIYASSYFIAPGGAYFNSGTVYAEAALQARGGVNDDGGSLLLSGSTGQVVVSDNSACATVGLVFDATDTDTGFCWVSEGGMRWYSNGVDTISITPTQIYLGGGAGPYTIVMDLGAQRTQRLCHNGVDGANQENQGIGDCTSGGSDLAEYYDTDGTLEPGDLVIAKGGVLVDNTSNTYQEGTFGVVSTNPPIDGIMGSDLVAPNRQPIGLAGRVPTKVSLENGPIQKGDYLTASSIPGVAMKATSAGWIVGIALEDYDGSQPRVSSLVSLEETRRTTYHVGFLAPYTSNPANWPSGVAKMMIYVNPGYHTPDPGAIQGASLEVNGNSVLTGNISISGILTVEDVVVNNDLVVAGNTELQGDLKVLGNTEVASLTVNGKIITAGASPTVVLGAATTGNGSNYSIEGNDTAGTITITTGTATIANPLAAGEQAVLTFTVPFTATPRVNITPTTEAAGNIGYYITKSGSEFKLHFTSTPQPNTTYSFDYQILQ